MKGPDGVIPVPPRGIGMTDTFIAMSRPKANVTLSMTDTLLISVKKES